MLALLAAVALAGPWAPPKHWAAVGDSTTHCCNTGGWPAEFERACHGAVSVTNYAVAGSTATQIRDEQWPLIRDAGTDVLLLHGGFNDIHNTDDSAATVFGRLVAVANDAIDAGTRVAFISILPAGGYFGEEKEGRRLGLMSLEKAWAADAGQIFVNLDNSLINCGDRFSDGAQALCAFAVYSDPVHPNEGANAAIGEFVAHQMECP